MNRGRLRVDLRARRSGRSARRLSSFLLRMIGLFAGAGFLLLACGHAIPSVHAGDGATTQPVGEWRYYAHDQGSTKYTPLSQINRDNAAKLAVEWTWESPYVEMRRNESHADLVRVRGHAADGRRHALRHQLALSRRGPRRANRQEKWVFDPESLQGRSAGEPGVRQSGRRLLDRRHARADLYRDARCPSVGH